MTLKERLAQGQYAVDTRKVADAILRSPLLIMIMAGDCAGRTSDPRPGVG